MSDSEMLASLRSLWIEADPMSAGLADRMVAAVAAEDINREYALLTLIEGGLGAVRGEADALTLQFSDGTTSILLHVTSAASGKRRVDGWIDGWIDTATAEITLTQGDRERVTTPADTGRFSFDDVPRGLTRVRLRANSDGTERELETPQFEL